MRVNPSPAKWDRSEKQRKIHKINFSANAFLYILGAADSGSDRIFRPVACRSASGGSREFKFEENGRTPLYFMLSWARNLSLADPENHML